MKTQGSQSGCAKARGTSGATVAGAVLGAAVLLSACAAPRPLPTTAPANTAAGAPATAALVSANGWQWARFTSPTGEMIVPNPARYVALFQPDGTLAIQADCNRATGRYTADGQSLIIQLGPTTLAACGADSLGDQFLKYLGAAAIWTPDGKALLIDLMADGGTMRFSPAEPSALPAVAPSGASALPEEMTTQLDTMLSTAVTSSTSPSLGKPTYGAILLVDTPAGQYWKAAGLSDLENGTPANPADAFEIGSNTKMFVGVLLTQLQEDGLLSFDDPLAKWLPDLAARIPNGDQVTLRMLANHTSGIWDYGDPLIGAGAPSDEALVKAYTPEELVDYAIQNGTPDFKPGEAGQWKYSNTGFILLGLVIEKAAGKPFEQVLIERILKPLGMNDTLMPKGSPEPGSLMQGYLMYGGKNTAAWNLSQGWAAGAIVSTMPDMLKFAKALETGAVFKNPESLKQMTDFYTEAPALAQAGFKGYGMGVGRFDDQSIGHRGQTLGFTSLVMMWPGQGATVLAVFNTSESSDILWQFTFSALFAAQAQTQPPAPALAGTTWELVRITDPMTVTEVAQPSAYTLAFLESNAVAVKADCNRARGTFTDNEAGAMTITVGAMTRVACPSGSLSDTFIKQLGFVRTGFIQDGHLFLDLMADGGTLEFAPAVQPASQ